MAPYAEQLAPYSQLLRSFYWRKTLAWKIGVGRKTYYEIDPWSLTFQYQMNTGLLLFRYSNDKKSYYLSHDQSDHLDTRQSSLFFRSWAKNKANSWPDYQTCRYPLYDLDFLSRTTDDYVVKQQKENKHVENIHLQLMFIVIICLFNQV